MAFSLEVESTEKIVFDSLGGLQMEGGVRKLPITIRAERLESLSSDGAHASVRYVISTDNCTVSGFGYVNFEYSGSGNPLEEAEVILQTQLNN